MVEDSSRASPSTAGDEDVMGEGGQHRGTIVCLLPSLYLSIYRGKEERGAPLGFPLGGPAARAWGGAVAKGQALGFPP